MNTDIPATESPSTPASPSTGQGIAVAAGIIAVGNVTSRILGLVREQVIAGLFGASAATDAFVAASAVPTIIFDLLMGGAISAALIPVFSDYAAPERRDELSRLASTLLILTLLTMGGLALVLEGIAPAVAYLVGGGFELPVLALTVRLIRFILPSVACFGVSAVLTGLLYSQQRFVFPAFGTAIYNLGIILGGLLLARHFGVAGLAMGVVLGAVLQMMMQVPGLHGLGLRPAFDLNHPGLRRILALYTPVLIGLVVSQAAVILDRNLASRTGEGSMAAMRFATTLIQFPLGLVVTAISMAVLPTLSRLASDRDLPEFRNTLALGLRMVLILIIPSTIGLAVLARPIVALLFQRGAFTPEDTSLTVLALLFYLIGLPCAAVDQPLIYAFYARKDTRTPVLVGVMAIGVYLVMALSLIRPLGMVGLVLANSAQWASHAAVMLILLHRRLDGVRGQGLVSVAGRALAAALVMAAMAWVVQGWLAGVFPGSGTLSNLVIVAGAGLAGGIVYLAVAALLGVGELRIIGDLILSRLGLATESHGRTQK